PRPCRLRKTLCLGFLILITHGVTRAATVNVDIEPFSFDPDPVTINVNDSVMWTWVSDFHDTTSDTPGLWASGLHNTGFTFTHTFTTAGTFPYSCTFHGFTGAVNVQGGNTLPSVTITNPVDGATL